MTKNNPPRAVSKDKLVGVLVLDNGKLRIKPCDKKKTSSLYDIDPADLMGAVEGDVVVMETKSRNASTAKVTRILGNKKSPGILSLISLSEKGLREEFSQAALNEAKSMGVPDLQEREDLRHTPLVTIDGADARDFDDAVFAEKTADGGFHLIVAIADVAWYVRSGSKLDEEAYARGNSTYFPDRVVPMLPEELSNGLCSLKPREDRACIAFHLWIDQDGNLTNKKVVRGLMNSAARLTYEQVQAAKDGQPDATTTPLMDNVIDPLYAAYAALRRAREKRGAMDLDVPEPKVSVDASGKAVNVKKTSRLNSHRLIEEFMVLANVAAASSLKDAQAPCVYRIHGTPPSRTRIEELRKLVGTFGLILPEGEADNPAFFKDVVAKAAHLPGGHQIIKAILRVQAKASYDTNNIGHFGLALEDYAHFTSPIRRYSDLLVHRSLIEAFNLGAGALDAKEKAQLDEMARHISETEDLSAKAERSARDRMTAEALSIHIGKEFNGRVASVTKAGLFVRLDNSGADGLLPVRDLPKDWYVFDETRKTLTGRDHGRVFAAGESIQVILKEADGLSGSILLKPANDNAAPASSSGLTLRKISGPKAP